MGRSLRAAPGGLAYHVLNRSNGGLRVFKSFGDYRAFEDVMAEARDRIPVRIVSYCIMPNHWHIVVWPSGDGDLSRFIGWLTLTHSQRWHAYRRTAGSGHVYQGRFKSFPIQTDEHLLTVCRYVERNPLRAKLVKQAEEWRWSSLWRRQFGDAIAKALLTDWPIDRPSDWIAMVNQAESDAELQAVRRSVKRNQPFGSDAWVREVVERFGLLSTVRPRGRPASIGMARL
jgi:putative transposase